ncbi:MAG: SHOCT domain-containing protein [Phycisphaerales bacterium]|nr:SHOCT domain-containing protein [Phycisphaerales bacterium]
MRYRAMASAGMLALVLGGAGCVSSSKVDVAPQSESIGKQLVDLEDAYNKGIINREEYEKARKRILDGK